VGIPLISLWKEHFRRKSIDEIDGFLKMEGKSENRCRGVSIHGRGKIY
jgi:hypothetical protein